ncbi:TPA: hypothetical protein HA242_07100 [Candidatus Woesearchaeota archaeon]|nr:hypothetical protein [Candidatus Woesearchaeota archaeon]HIG93853.1 hypothetical protein [Candidatus Woesearchaeota archaeon]HIH13462.1 hypothetical protein [Candidatus Woesearchaeota archaeon]
MKTTSEEILKETMDEINAALQDSRGIVAHQRRLAFVISVSSVALLESFLQKRHVFKSGAKINHQWLKKKKDNVKIKLASQVTCPLESLPELDNFLEQSYALEKERNQMAYGKLVVEEKLQELINLFLKFKKEVENA